MHSYISGKLFRPTHDEPRTYTEEEHQAALKDTVSKDKMNEVVEERLARDRAARQKDDDARKAENVKVIEQLEILKKAESTTVEEKTNLELQITRLQSESSSKEEVAARTMAETTKKHEASISALQLDSDNWKKMYEGKMVESAIRQAATEQGAASQAHDLLVPILGSMNSRVEPILDEGGKSTGGFLPVVTFQDVNAEGKAFVTEAMPILDAVKRMKELPEKFGNLFTETMTGGAGGSSGSGGKGSGVSPGNLDPKEYQKQRAAGALPHQQQ